MAEQRFLTNSVSWAGPTTREAEPIAKGEPAARGGQKSERSISEPSSLKIATSSVAGEGQASRRRGLEKPPKDIAVYRTFRRLCDRILDELGKIGPFFAGDQVSDEGVEVVAEIEALLEELYTCPHGQGEFLKRLVVAVQSQVNNADWDRRHVAFLREIVRFLRGRYLLDEGTVDACYDLMKEQGLDRFRGTICEPRAVKRYRIEEVDENDKSRESND